VGRLVKLCPDDCAEGCIWSPCPQINPRPSAPRIAGAIDRAVVDTAAAYSAKLAELWAASLSRDAGPWDD
jgi:hypothetical protein